MFPSINVDYRIEKANKLIDTELITSLLKRSAMPWSSIKVVRMGDKFILPLICFARIRCPRAMSHRAKHNMFTDDLSR